MDHMTAPPVVSSEQTVPELITAYKYILTDTGVIFVLGRPLVCNSGKSKKITLTKGKNGMVFLRLGDIYALLTDRIIDHLKKIMELMPQVAITFAQSLPDDYEIRSSHTSEVDRVNCATLISLYRLANGGSFGETQG
jgi:hypothetical protein